MQLVTSDYFRRVRGREVGLHRNIEDRVTVENRQPLNKLRSLIMSLFTEVEIDFRIKYYTGRERAKIYFL